MTLRRDKRDGFLAALVAAGIIGGKCVEIALDWRDYRNSTPVYEETDPALEEQRREIIDPLNLSPRVIPIEDANVSMLY